MHHRTLTDIKRLTNQKLFEQGSDFQGNMPLCLRFSLLDDCNIHCGMCQRNALPPQLKKTLSHDKFDLDLYKSIASESFPYAEKVSFEIAGEPTLHPQFSEFLAVAQEFNTVVEVWTNGTTLHNPSISKAILDHVDILVISIDTFDPNLFTSIRKGANLEQIKNSIKQLKQASLRTKKNKPLRIAINATLMKKTISQLPDLVQQSSQLGIDEIYGCHIGFFETTPNQESLFLNKQESNDYVQKANEIGQQQNIALYFPPLFNESNEIETNPHFHCSWVNHTTIILCNGDVIPCCHAAARFQLVIGNIHDSKLSDIWYSPAYMFLRNSLEKKQFFPPCQDCVSNNPFIDTSRTWSLKNTLKNSNRSLNDNSFLKNIATFEKNLFQHQNQKKEETITLEQKICQGIEHAQFQEKKFEQLHPFKSVLHKKHICHATKFEKYMRNRVHGWGDYAAILPGINLNREFNDILYRQDTDFQGNLPVNIEVALIEGCNISCIMCNFAGIPPHKKKKMLESKISMETFHRIEEQLFPYAQSIFFGIGGEPTLHPDFPLFIKKAKAAGLQVNVSSNGLCFNQKHIAQTAVECITNLIISVDGACQATYERIRKGARWDTLLNSITNLVTRQRQFHTAGMQLAINFTLMKDNIHEFPQVIELAHQMGIQTVMAEHLIITSPQLEEQSLFHHKELSDHYLLQAIEKGARLNVKVRIPDLFDMSKKPKQATPGTIRNIRPQQKAKHISFCEPLDHSLVIIPDGSVVTCSHPEAQRLFRFGNINQHSIQEIWYGNKYQELRNCHQDQLPYPCNNCSMSGRSDGTLPFQNKKNHPSWPKTKKTSIYPKTFILNRLHLSERLFEQNRHLQIHYNNLIIIHDHLQKHNSNLKKMLHLSHSNYQASLHWIKKPPEIITTNAYFSFCVDVKNTGTQTWTPGNSETDQSIMIGGTFYHKKHKIYLEGWGILNEPLLPGQSTKVEINSNTCSLKTGTYTLKIEPVKLGVGFFEEFGSKPLESTIQITEPDSSEKLWERGIKRCTNLWTPTQGIRQNSRKKFPLFITHTNQARIVDEGGQEYLDYIMGWGTATLGYNHPAITQAVSKHLETGPTLPLPHPLQVQAAEKLCTFLPCAERILFGKNGSDVLEAAIRIARALTQKDHILCCGFHGFHDWYVSSIPNVEGIPKGMRELTHPFSYGNLDELRSLITAYSSSVAAVVIEPASLAYPPDDYLQTIHQWTKEENIILIFDEIMSAFRLANGGAQEIYQVCPDLVTVGKGIANGLPLAALAGPDRIMQKAFSIGYGPTFQGEVYALAAANAALEIYATEPVCHHLNNLGYQLKDGILKAAKKHELDIEILGIAPRQVLQFNPIHQISSIEQRTFFIQELLQHGILFGGTFLPSYAHTLSDIEFTLNCIDEIFSDLHSAIEHGNLKDNIHIPSHILFLGEEKS